MFEEFNNFDIFAFDSISNNIEKYEYVAISTRKNKISDSKY